MNFAFIAAQFVFIACFVALAIGKLSGEVEVKSETAPFYESGMDTGAIFAGAAVLALDFLASTGSRRCRRRRPTRRAGSRWRSCCARCASSSPTRGTSCSRTSARSPTGRTWPARTS